MTLRSHRSRRFDWFAFHRRPSVEQQNTAGWPPNLRSGGLSVALCFGAIAIGIIALTGFVLGNASIASLGAGKPVALVTALALIVLGTGLLALRSPAPAGVMTARRAALVVVVVTAADLLSAALSSHIEEWQVWSARGGVLVHPYFITGLILLALGSALLFLTTRRDFAGHVIASATLLISLVILFGHLLKVPSFLDRAQIVAPVAATACGLALISAAALLARPRGWVALLLSRTVTGVMSRVLLLATFTVPLLSSALRDLIAGTRWFTPAVDYAVVVDVAELFFNAAVVLSVGVFVYRHERDRLRLASIVESSTDAIIGTSSDGLVESWNGGAEQMYGYTTAEAIGRPVTVLAPRDRQEEAPRLLERIRRGERVDPVETVRVAKDGRRIDVWLSVSPILDDEGSLAGVSSIARDITGRKKAEEAVVKSEARYRTLVENLPQKIFLKDRNSVYVSVNEAYARDLGLEPKAVAGKTDHDFFPEHLAGKYRADDARIMEAGVTEDLEEEYVERGQRRFIHTVKTPVKDSQGTVTSILGILWDITERKLAEEKLEKAMAELERSNRDLARSEATLKEAQRIAHVGHWESSLVTGAVKWSDEVYRILGIPIGSVTPSYEILLGMMDSKDRRDQEDASARALASSDADDADAETELRVTTRAGDALVLSQRVFVDRDAAGNVVGFHGTVQDITQRVATEQALRDSEAALAEAQQIAHVGSAIVHPETGEINASDEFFRIFDLEPGREAGITTFLDRVHEEDRGAVQAALKAAVSSGTFDVEFRIVCGDGSIRFAHSIARRQQSESRVFSFIGTVDNVTERKLAEDTLRQHTESLKQSNLELERFNRLAVGRELRMIELKRQINDLCAQSGQPPPYVLPEERAAQIHTANAASRPPADLTS